MEENSKRIVLCGANAYDKKYYFNEQFKGIPQSIQDELHIMCVLFTEEVGGVFTIVFEEDGSVSFDTESYEEDILSSNVPHVLRCIATYLPQVKVYVPEFAGCFHLAV